jgi:ribosome biogenesis protein ERB1
MDKTAQADVELTDEELELIRRLATSENPDADYDRGPDLSISRRVDLTPLSAYEPTIEWFSSKQMTTALSGKPEPKRRFIPSKWEHKKVSLLRCGNAPADSDARS